MNKIENIKYEIDSYGCWICKNYIDPNGYGSIKVKQKTTKAHRRMYEITKGEIPSNLVVRHTCDVRCCVNPDHLILGTIQDNNQDTVDRNRTRKGSKHGQSKLTEKEVEQIIFDRKNSKITLTQLSIKYNISRGTIKQIVYNKKWTHVQR